MANYVKQTNFAVKDSLPPGNANKVVRGAEIDTEFNAISTAISTKLDASDLPIGAIIIWSGPTNAIPAKWALCNGLNNTPNLRDKFVVGAGGAYDVAAQGGAATVTLTEANLPLHTHTGTTVNGGSHNHSGETSLSGSHSHASGISYNAAIYGGGGPQDDIGASMDNPVVTGVNGEHSHFYTTSTHTGHTHFFTTNATGGGTAHENMPPYYALAYIMKIA